LRIGLEFHLMWNLLAGLPAITDFLDEGRGWFTQH